MESYQGDGNNIIEVYRLTSQAISKAKQDDGPTFLEFKTYRWRTHCGGRYDNDLGYRTQSEFEEWKRLCPIEHLKSILLKEGIQTNEDFNNMVMEIEAEVEEAIMFSKQSSEPDKSALLEHIYTA